MRLVLSHILRHDSQRGDGSVRHRNGAAVAGFDLSPDVKLRGARGMGYGIIARPRRGVQTAARCDAHELVICRMEFDFVDASPEAIVRAKVGRIFVREPSPFLRAFAAREPPEFVQLGKRGRSTFMRERFNKGAVAAKRVVVAQRRRLIEHRMRLAGHPAHSVAAERISCRRSASVAASSRASSATAANARYVLRYAAASESA